MFQDTPTFAEGDEVEITDFPNRRFAKQGCIALVGGFSPRQCGIATFTADVCASLLAASPHLVINVYAMSPADGKTAFDPGVCAAICENEPLSFAAAALSIEESRPGMVWLQHEFGLYGGPAGDMIFELIDRISAPLVITLHTVLPQPDTAHRAVMDRLIGRAAKLVVMSQHSAALLGSVYGASAEQIVVIPHGAPDRPFGRSADFKRKFGLTGRQVLMTFGLLSPGKGIEAVIAALPSIIADHPQALYCIVGATHPNLIAREGEAYRIRLHALAARLGVEDHIEWHNAFVENGELLDRIEAADIYVTPYPGAGQSTSGTLAYAVALGKAVVSTPYVHAKELLADDHGVFVPFGDSAAIAREINVLLDDPQKLSLLQQRAYVRGREMVWPVFAAQSLAVIDTVLQPPSVPPVFGPIGIEGLLRICDDTGILQHSIRSVPDRAHGYCVDDNARALMLVNRLGAATEPHRSRLTSVFAGFVQSAWNPDAGNFRNFMGFGRNWLEDAGSEDSRGRSVWALGATSFEGQTAPIRDWAADLFDETALCVHDFGSPRAAAFAMLGADYRLAANPDQPLATTILQNGADWLNHLLGEVRRPDWVWFETVLAYDNCRLPEALIRAGLRLKNAEFVEAGIDALHWIMAVQIAGAGHFRPVGSGSFGQELEMPRPFDQQPVEAWAAIDACAAAYDASGSNRWIKQARCAYDWFGGRNDRGIAVGQRDTGSCHDGINPRGLNLNQGAESVLAYQHATLAMRKLLASAI